MHDPKQVTIFLACENMRFSSLFVAGDVSPAATSEEKRIFSQATLFFFYKNIFYKNIDAEICEILRIL